MSDAAPSTEPAPSPKKRRGCLWWTLAIAGVALLTIVISAAYVWQQLNALPEYWSPLDATDPQVQRTGEVIEQQVTSTTTRVRPAADAWTLELTQDEANAWLASRMPKWLENQNVDRTLIEQLRRSMVRFQPDRVELAVQGLFGERVLRAIYAPGEPVDDLATLKLTGLMTGRIALPVETVLDKVAAAEPRFDAQARSMLENPPLLVPLGDGRVVQCERIEVGDGTIRLTCRTVRGNAN